MNEFTAVTTNFKASDPFPKVDLNPSNRYPQLCELVEDDIIYNIEEWVKAIEEEINPHPKNCKHKMSYWLDIGCDY